MMDWPCTRGLLWPMVHSTSSDILHTVSDFPTERNTPVGAYASLRFLTKDYEIGQNIMGRIRSGDPASGQNQAPFFNAREKRGGDLLGKSPTVGLLIGRWNGDAERLDNDT